MSACYRYFLEIQYPGEFKPPLKFRNFLDNYTKKFAYKVYNYDDFNVIVVKFSLKIKQEEFDLVDTLMEYFTGLVGEAEIRMLYPKPGVNWQGFDIPKPADEPLGESALFTKASPTWVDVNVPSYPWQREVLEMIKGEPDDRTITNIVNPKGGVGKTTLVRYLVWNSLAKVVPTTGSVSQMAAFLDRNWGEKVYLLDMPRVKLEQEVYINLAQLLESLKNGMLTSTFYGGSTTKMSNPPFVIIFSNQEFPMKFFSEDRIDVKYVDGIHDKLMDKLE